MRRLCDGHAKLTRAARARKSLGCSKSAQPVAQLCGRSQRMARIRSEPRALMIGSTLSGKFVQPRWIVDEDLLAHRGV
jgi:hypothetical protein